MSIFTQNIPHKKKPDGIQRIDRSNPLTRGLVGFWLFNEGSAKGRNLVGRYGDATLSAAASWVITPKGRAVDLAGAGEMHCDGDSRLNLASAVSFCCEYYHLGASENYEACFAGDGQWSLTTGWQFGTDLTTNRDGIRFVECKASNSVYGPSSVLNINAWNTIGFSTTVGNNYHFYVDGKNVQSTGSSAIVLSSNDMYLGAAAGTRDATGQMLWAAEWDRELTAAEFRSVYENPYQLLEPIRDVIYFEDAAAISATLTGTVTASITESDIVTGGKTIILTLTGDTWVSSGATFNAQRQNIIDGIDSAQSEGTGWDAEVKANESVTAVARTNDTVVTVTLSAAAAYDITAQETITATIPATALVTSVSAVVASPTFTVDIVSAAAFKAGTLSLLGVGI